MVTSDLDVFYEQQRDDEAARMAAFPVRDHHAFSAHWQRVMADESIVAKTIVVEGVIAGNIVSWVEGDERLVGYWIGKPHWGKGIASTALAAFVDQIKHRPLLARVAKHNLGSIRVLQKAGFEMVGEELAADGIGDRVVELHYRLE